MQRRERRGWREGSAWQGRGTGREAGSGRRCELVSRASSAAAFAPSKSRQQRRAICRYNFVGTFLAPSQLTQLSPRRVLFVINKQSILFFHFTHSDILIFIFSPFSRVLVSPANRHLAPCGGSDESQLLLVSVNPELRPVGSSPAASETSRRLPHHRRLQVSGGDWTGCGRACMTLAALLFISVLT